MFTPRSYGTSPCTDPAAGPAMDAARRLVGPPRGFSRIFRGRHERRVRAVAAGLERYARAEEDTRNAAVASVWAERTAPDDSANKPNLQPTTFARLQQLGDRAIRELQLSGASYMVISVHSDGATIALSGVRTSHIGAVPILGGRRVCVAVGDVRVLTDS